MAQWDDVHIKQRIEISANIGNQDYNFGSMIVRKNDTAVFFHMPSSQHSTKVIRKGVVLQITIHADKKDLNFSGEVAVIHPGNPPTVQINRPKDEEISIVGNVDSYGLKDRIPLTYRILRDPVTPISDVKKGETVSISSDDAVIATVGKINPDSFIELTLNLPSGDAVTFVGKVDTITEVKSGAQVSYESHVRYEIIRPGEQDKIVKYTFDKQRSLRKRGMY